MGFVESLTGLRSGEVIKYSASRYGLITYNLDGGFHSEVIRPFQNKFVAQDEFRKETIREGMTMLGFYGVGLSLIAKSVIDFDDPKAVAIEAGVGFVLLRIGMNHLHRMRLASGALYEASRKD